jgi:type VI secretion system secreted protein VgrG
MDLSRTAFFSSPLADKLMFYQMTGQEELGGLFSIEVDLLSSDEAVDLAALLGQEASVHIERTDASVREFNGFVTSFALVGQHGNFARYRAVLRPWLWFLGQNQTSRIFQESTVPDIVKEIFREHGFSDFEESLNGDYRKWEYLVQYRESDLNFVSRMLEQEGIHYYFKHADGKHKLVLADSNNAHTPSPGYEAVPFFPPLARERRQDEHISKLVLHRRVRPGKFTARDWQFKTPEILEKDRKSPLESAFNEYEIYDFPGEFEDIEQATTQAQLRLEEYQVDYETVEGSGPIRGLFAGSRFALTQYPREDQNREYLILSARYEVRVSEYESNAVPDKEPIFEFKFVAIDAKRPYRAARRTRKPRVEGVHTAKVVGAEGEEIHTDPFGRVRVKFHWDRREEENEKSSCYVRVSQLWAGQNWGGQFLPRVGQEVIVDFLEGDPDRPIITGRVYNQAQMPPYALPNNATQSGIKTRSSPGGKPSNFNEMRFEDKKGSEEFYFQAEKNTLVKNDQSTTVKGSRSASISHDDSVSVTGDRSVSVGGNLSVTVKGGGKSPVHSTHSVKGKHSVDASDTIEMTAPTHISFTVGKSVIILTPDAINLMAQTGAAMALDPNVFTVAKGEAHLMLDPNAFIMAKGGASLLLDPNVAVTSAEGGAQLLLDGNAALGAQGNVTLDGMTVAGTGKTEAGFSCVTQSFALTGDTSTLGAGMINVQGMGMVSIVGTSVKVN